MKPVPVFRFPLLRIAPILALLLAGAAVAQQQKVFFPDYVPVDRKTYCRRTFQWTFGPTGQEHSEVIGSITVPYTSGPLSGALLCNWIPGDPDLSVGCNDGVTFRNLMDGDHYPSTDCLLTAYPSEILPEKVHDRLFFEFAPNYVVVRKGLSECELSGDSDDAWWFRIQDVTVQGRSYENALIIWNFDSGPFVTLNLQGKDVALGITAPTKDVPSDPRDRAVDSFLIFAEGVGLIAAGRIHSESGELFALGELVSISCQEKAPVFDAFDVPGTRNTSAQGANDSGDVVGHYAFNPGDPFHGFVRHKAGALTTIDFPDSTDTFARDINNRGDIAGYYVDADNVQHGFLLRNGWFTSIDVPGALGTQAASINDQGDVVGFYQGAGSIQHGFLLRQGSLTQIDFPGALLTQALDINNRGTIVGLYRHATGPAHGFVMADGAFRSIDVPGALLTQARGINDAGAIVGTYSEPDGLPRGFLLDKGIFQTIHVPCAERTVLHDVTTRGDPVGHFVDRHGFVYGFSVTP